MRLWCVFADAKKAAKLVGVFSRKEIAFQLVKRATATTWVMPVTLNALLDETCFDLADVVVR